jgi:hypothetical protein
MIPIRSAAVRLTERDRQTKLYTEYKRTQAIQFFQKYESSRDLRTDRKENKTPPCLAANKHTRTYVRTDTYFRFYIDNYNNM